MLAGLVLSLVFSTSAVAQEAPKSDIEIRRLADIYPHLPPPGAKKWEPTKILVAIEASSMSFSPRHVYELIDKEVPQPIIKAVANKVGLFYDGSQKPLSVQAAEARQGVAPETIEVTEANFPAMFEWFTTLFKAIDTTEEQLGIPSMKQANETDALYERRQRAWEEDRVKRLGPLEGRIQSATFVLKLPASVQTMEGCERPVAVGDASAVDFDVFRRVSGSRLSDTPVQFTSHSIEKLMFSVAPTRRVVAMGRCGARSSSLDVTMKRTAEGAWSASGDFR